MSSALDNHYPKDIYYSNLLWYMDVKLSASIRNYGDALRANQLSLLTQHLVLSE